MKQQFEESPIKLKLQQIKTQSQEKRQYDNFLKSKEIENRSIYKNMNIDVKKERQKSKETGESPLMERLKAPVFLNSARIQLFNEKRIENQRSISLVLPKSGQIGSLYLGNYQAAQNTNLLRDRQVKAVLTIGNDLNVSYNSINSVLTVQGKQPNVNDLSIKDTFFIEHLNLYALDTSTYDISVHFKKAIEFIEKCRMAGVNILVHCAAGVSRSATLVIVYLIWKYSFTFSQAFNFVKEKRFIIKPNTGFTRRIKQFEYIQLSEQINSK